MTISCWVITLFPFFPDRISFAPLQRREADGDLAHTDAYGDPSLPTESTYSVASKHLVSQYEILYLGSKHLGSKHKVLHLLAFVGSWADPSRAAVNRCPIHRLQSMFYSDTKIRANLNCRDPAIASIAR